MGLKKAATKNLSESNPPPASNDSSVPSEAVISNELSTSNEWSGFGKRISRRCNHIMSQMKRKDPRCEATASETTEANAPRTKKWKKIETSN